MSDEEGNQSFPRDKAASGSDANEPVHEEGVRQGNEMVGEEGKEAGRFDKGTTGADRPAGGSTSRDSTGVNPKDPIDPESPTIPSE